MAEVELQTVGGTGGMNQTQDFEPDVLKSVDAADSSVADGVENPAFSTEQEGPNVPAPMAYVEFIPQLLEEAASQADTPRYAEFSTVLEQANQYLQSVPDFVVMKLESFVKKLDKDEPEIDQVTHHQSSYGVNRYVRSLRLWLAPRGELETPQQQIGYMTLTPEAADGTVSTAESVLALFTPSAFRSSVVTPPYCGSQETMDRLNKFLKKKPLPGSILNIETVMVKYEENATKCLNTEKMCWSDCGKTDSVYIHATRVYYIIGKPAFEVIGFHDEKPVCLNNWEIMSRMRFCPFTTVLQRAKKWLRIQKGIRVVNMQTVDILCNRGKEGEAKVHSDKSGHVLPSGTDVQFSRVLRIFYTIDAKVDVCPYDKLELTTRLFIPTRHGDYGRTCETFSKTMQRVIKWLQLTKTPIFGVETVEHPFSPDSYGTGIQEDSAGMSLIANAGKYYLTTVRLYFPCEYQEPAPEELPQVPEEEGWYMCSLS